jgi:hypothetical protein
MKIKRPPNSPLPKITLKLDDCPFSSLNFYFIFCMGTQGMWVLTQFSFSLKNMKIKWPPNYPLYKKFIFFLAKNLGETGGRPIHLFLK